MKRLLINKLLCLFCLNAWSYNCQVDRPELSVYFGNGMFTGLTEARDALIKLRSSTSGSFTGYRVKYKLSYNNNEFWYEQIQEVGRQKGIEDNHQLLNWLSGLEVAPDWFREAVLDMASTYDSFSYILDGDLQRHTSNYLKDIENCQKVLLVAHSQGNFYGNEAWRLVYKRTVGSLSLNQLRVMGMVSVATPASHVGSPLANGSDLGSITRYFTLSDDLVINAVRLFLNDALEGNLVNSSESPDWKNHSFIDSYLFGAPSRSHIQSAVQEVSLSLETLPFERRGLASSAISSAGYDPVAQILEIEFASSGSVYRYYDVPERIYSELVSADSVGRYYNLSIRGQFLSRRLY
ncbi:KTSC domain-containing protein [Endozoicomonas sp. ONNA1]|uniref:KTSC domain-containing protein n=1 Tax=Endozoicomonas sp. ONNA1 TaxID=2828740 RepID=UPI0021474637|nr:KTSC domain-containing protein [Endozoicomonas sp. ONNA1]